MNSPAEFALQLLARLARDHDEGQSARIQRCISRGCAHAGQIGVNNCRVASDILNQIQRLS
jgi:hypothetical protein